MPLFTPDLEFYLEKHAPGYITYVQRCIRQKRPVVLVLEGYRSNRDRVQACLWHAIEQGWAVTVVSPQAWGEWKENPEPAEGFNS
jgi:hypothetical protein